MFEVAGRCAGSGGKACKSRPAERGSPACLAGKFCGPPAIFGLCTHPPLSTRRRAPPPAPQQASALSPTLQARPGLSQTPQQRLPAPQQAPDAPVAALLTPAPRRQRAAAASAPRLWTRAAPPHPRGRRPAAMSKNPKGVVNTFRRTWDKEEFREKAEQREEKVRWWCGAAWPAPAAVARGLHGCCYPHLAPHPCPPSTPQEKKVDDEEMDARKRKRLERDPLHQGLIVARANLKARDYQIDLASKLHKTQVRGGAGAAGHARSWRQAHRRLLECVHAAPLLRLRACHACQLAPARPAPAPRPPSAGGVGGDAAGAASGLLLQRVRLCAAGQPVIPGSHQRCVRPCVCARVWSLGWWGRAGGRVGGYPARRQPRALRVLPPPALTPAPWPPPRPPQASGTTARWA